MIRCMDEREFCDGLWQHDDHTRCPHPVVLFCMCTRCASEGPGGRFASCEDKVHQTRAAERHTRIRGRRAAWCSTT